MAGVSLIVATHERVAALQETLPSLLAVAGVEELVFVDDGSTDGTADLLRAIPDARVRVVLQPRRLGLPAARNRGLAESTGQWIVFGEDDVRSPRDYVTVLLQEAAAHRAQIVGAPFLLVLEGEDALPGAIADARAYAVDSIGLDQVETFPTRVLRTPFIPAPALVHRSVVDAGIRFDEGYRGNAYREETAFFCEAVRHGFTSILTPRTVSYQTSGWRGGAHTTLLPPLRAVDDPEHRALPGPARAVACTGRACRPTRSRGSAVRARARAADVCNRNVRARRRGSHRGRGDDRRADAGARQRRRSFRTRASLVRSKQQRSSHRGAITDGMP